MKQLSILVLEDEPFQRLIAVTALRQLGLERIHQAADGTEALARLEACGGVDIVLCDLRMAGMDGLAFLRHASQAGVIRSVILCSEVAPELRHATIAMIQNLGLNFLGDLGKPFDFAHAAALIRRHPLATDCLLPGQDSGAPCLDDIFQALERGEFVAFFQPKVCLDSGALLGAEVLARWRHPERGLLPPSQFLPLMEANHLIERLFWQLFEQGLALQQALGRDNLQVNLAFNLQPRQLASHALVKRIAKALEDAGLPGSGLTFELTETGLLEAPAASLENLVRLRLMGSELAMDDFGAGYSSLDRLCELPFSQIKLDASFVRKLDNQPRSGAIVGSAVALAEALGMTLVVEGVETSAQRDRLRSLGCRVAQGFLFHRPMDCESFSALLAQQALCGRH